MSGGDIPQRPPRSTGAPQIITAPDTLGVDLVASGLFPTPLAGERGAPPPSGASSLAALGALRQMAETLSAIGAALGLTPGELAEHEAFDRLERRATLSVANCAALPLDAVRDWFDTLGDDLELDLALLGLDPALDSAIDQALDTDTMLDHTRAELRRHADPVGALRAFQRAADQVASTQGDSVSVEITLRAGKRHAIQLAADYLTARRATSDGWRYSWSAPERTLVFYSAAACARLLTLRDARAWEQRGLGGAETRLCVIVCDSSGALAGPALEVIGAAPVFAGTSPCDAEETSLPLSRAAWRRFTRRCEAIGSLRDAESAWSNVALTLLPDHLRVIPLALAAPAPAPADGSTAHGLPSGTLASGTLADGTLAVVAARLMALRVEVAACALASHVERSTANDDHITLRFAGARPATLALPLVPPRAADPASVSADGEADGEAIAPAHAAALIAFVEWAYRDTSPDKLAIARQALASALPPGATLTLAEVCAAATVALDAARANFAIYLRGATERYFQMRAAALQTVSAFADDTRKAVMDLTNDIVDNVFRTVGLIVGVLVAWLVQPGASLALARIGALLYTGYVLFIICFLLRARHDRFELGCAGLDATLTAMPEITPDERERLRRPARDAERYFLRYLWRARVIYGVLACLGGLICIAMWLPPISHLIAPHLASTLAPPLAPTILPAVSPTSAARP